MRCCFYAISVILILFNTFPIASADVLVQTEINEDELFQAIQEAYNQFQSERVIQLANEFLEQFPACPLERKIRILEFKAYSQYDLRRESQARKTIIEILKLDIDFHPDPQIVSPKKIKFVEGVKAKVTSKLHIHTEQYVCTVFINEGESQKTPCTYTLLEGDYTVTIESPVDSLQDSVHQVNLEGGKDQVLDITLQPIDQPQVVTAEKTKRAWYKNPFVIGGAAVVGGVAAIIGTTSSSSTTTEDKPLPRHPARPKR